MPIREEHAHDTAFLEDSDMAEFKSLLGPAAAEFRDADLLQLRRELWAWAEFVVDLFESEEYRPLFDQPGGSPYDESNGPSRDRKPKQPNQ